MEVRGGEKKATTSQDGRALQKRRQGRFDFFFLEHVRVEVGGGAARLCSVVAFPDLLPGKRE